MEASRQIMWNIGNHLFLEVATLLAATSLAAGLFFRVTTWRHGVAGAPRIHRVVRLLTALRGIFNQRGMIRGRIYLIMHRSLFFGMLVLAAGSALIALEMHFKMAPPRGASYLALSLILDLAGAAVLVGVALAVYKRYILKPGRLESRFSDAGVLALLGAIVGSGFLVKGARIYATSAPFAFLSPISGAVSWVVSNLVAPEGSESFHAALWYGHATLAFAFLMLFPWTNCCTCWLFRSSSAWRRPGAIGPPWVCHSLERPLPAPFRIAPGSRTLSPTPAWSAAGVKSSVPFTRGGSRSLPSP